jgi:hypothetical protein
MNIKRNVLTIVAGTLLVTALPATAQGLGGSLGGAASGALSGRFDDAATFGSVRDRAQQVGGRTRTAAGNAASAGKSRLEATRTASAATVQEAPQAQAQAGSGGLLVEGNGAGAVEKQVMGRNVAAQGSGASQTRADRSGLATDSSGGASAAVTKESPAVEAEAAPAQ